MRRARSALLLSLLMAAPACAPLHQGIGPAPVSSRSDRNAADRIDSLDPRVMSLFLQAQLALREPAPVGAIDDRSDRAAHLLQEALAEEPRSSQLWQFLARAWADKPDYHLAVAAARQSVDLDPSNARARYLLGEQLHRLGRVEEAEPHLRVAVELGVGGDEPHLPHYYLYTVLKELKRPDEAVQALDAWSLALPEDDRPAVLKAVLLWDSGQHEPARDAALEALRREPGSERPLRILTTFHEDNPLRASEAIEQVLKIDWSTPELHRLLVDLYDEMGRFDKALEQLRYVEILDQSDPEETLRTKVRLRLAMHESGLAGELLEGWLETATEASRERLVLLLAQVRWERGEERSALELLAQASREGGRPWDAGLYRARLLLASGDTAGADAVVEGLLDGLPQRDMERRVQALDLSLTTTLRLQDWDRAQERLDALKRLDGGLGAAAEVRLLLARERFDDAVASASGLVQDRPFDVNAAQQLADVLVRAGRADDAIAALDAAMGRITARRDELMNEASGEEAWEQRSRERRARRVLLLRRSFVERGRDDLSAAERSLQAAHEIAPDDADVMNALGYLWAEQATKLGAAAELIGRALEQRPYSGAMQDSMGWVHFQSGALRPALERLETARRYAGDDPEILEHLGDTHRALGDMRRARGAYRDSLEALNDSPVPEAPLTAALRLRVEEKLQKLGARGRSGAR